MNLTSQYFFSFDDLKILGGFGDNVHIQGIKSTYDKTSTMKMEVGVSYKFSDLPSSSEEDCILSINRKLFQKMMDKWLDSKLDYCDRWEHYCGVGGEIYCEKVKKEYDTHIYEYNINEIDDGVKETKRNMVVYTVDSFNEVIDMEHG